MDFHTQIHPERIFGKNTNEYYLGYQEGLKDGRSLHDANTFWMSTACADFSEGYGDGHLDGWEEYEQKTGLDIPLCYHTIGDNKSKYSLRFAREGPWEDVGPLPPPFDAIVETEEEKNARETREKQEEEKAQEYIRKTRLEHSQKIEDIEKESRKNLLVIREAYAPKKPEEKKRRRKKKKKDWRSQSNKQIFRRKRR